jgi:LysM repeat protein
MQFSINDYSRNAEAKGWGQGWPHDISGKMVSVKADKSGKKVQVHHRISRLVDMMLDESERRGYRMRKLGGYCNRQIRKKGKPTGKPSNHSWGLAIDVNWDVNEERWDGKLIENIPEWMNHMFNRYGFAWGGDYRHGDHRDPMHFEFMGSPADADRMTARAVKEIRQQKPAVAKTPAPVAHRYTVKTGDSLSEIVTTQHLGCDWQELYKLNRKLIGPDPDLIRPGQVLVLP